MSVSTVDLYGAPSYGPIGRPPAGIVFHTPENADATLQQALNTAQWQASPGNTQGGSYHGILAYDPESVGGMSDPDSWVMVRTVPWDKAAGGITSQRTNPPWNPDGRMPAETIAALTEDAYGNPNRWMHQIALGGNARWYVTNGYPSGLVTRLAEWVKILEEAYHHNETDDAILTLHRHWQTDRTDPGPLNLIDLILAEYERLYGDDPVVMPQRFTDVPPSHWAYEVIERAAVKGIATGRPDGTFGPDDAATRAEVLAFIERAG